MSDDEPDLTWLADMTWPECASAIAADRIFIIPIGAAAKEHGAHLPLGTDHHLAGEFMRRLALEVKLVATPVVSYGYYPAFINFPGSLGISDQLFRDLVRSVADNLMRFGARKIAILNTGVSTTPELLKVVRAVHAEAEHEVLLLNIRDLYQSARRALDLTHPMTHADMMETSLILAIDENLVRHEKIENVSRDVKRNAATVHASALPLDPEDKVSPAYCPSGVLGDPEGADGALGDKVFDAMTREIIAQFNTRWP